MSISLKTRSYFNTGGQVKKFFEPTSMQEFEENVLEISKDYSNKFFMLGAGSNSLVSDEYYDGAVLSFAALNAIETRENHQVYAEAGVINTELYKFCSKQKLAGTAWMNRLPGQIGATARMNARCYGGEISQIVSEVIYFDFTTKKLCRVKADEKLFRGYKDTWFMVHPSAIAAVFFDLKEASDEEQAAQLKLAQHCEDDRQAKQQFDYPSCGCVFKNDYSVGVPSGLLLQHAGAKKLRYGKAWVHGKHANFIFHEDATSFDVLELSFQMRELVYQEFGVWLQYEMEFLGEIPPSQKPQFLESRTHLPANKKLIEVKKEFESRAN